MDAGVSLRRSAVVEDEGVHEVWLQQATDRRLTEIPPQRYFLGDTSVELRGGGLSGSMPVRRGGLTRRTVALQRDFWFRLRKLPTLTSPERGRGGIFVMFHVTGPFGTGSSG